jgi:hypothetical protein
MGKVDHHKDLSDQEDELAVSAAVVQGLPSHPPYPSGEQAAVCAGATPRRRTAAQARSAPPARCCPSDSTRSARHSPSSSATHRQNTDTASSDYTRAHCQQADNPPHSPNSRRSSVGYTPALHTATPDTTYISMFLCFYDERQAVLKGSNPTSSILRHIAHKVSDICHSAQFSAVQSDTPQRLIARIR